MKKEMNRKKKFFLNTSVVLFYQMTTVICGFILPKFLIPHFGSKVNGLLNSITQFLAFITFLESGVGAVVQSSLYKPLAEKDNKKLSQVIVSSNNFFNKIMIITFFYVFGLVFFYYFIVKSEFDFIYTALLIIILALNFIAQHYLFLSYRLLLNADQLSFVQLLIHSFCLIINTITTIVLISFNMGIHIVKLASMLIFAIQPILLKYIVDRKYDLNLKVELTEEPIKQKWNGFAQHIASVILSNTDTVVLTLFSTLENVSIYSVYYLVVHGIKQIINSLMNGIQSLLGNMLANDEKTKLNDTFDSIELVSNNIVLLLYVMTGIMITPFVLVYTKNFNDANYVSTYFGILLTIAYGLFSLRTPYEMMIKAAGHYKETQWSYIVEALINITLSVFFVFKYGLIGVAIGTLVAMLYRTIYVVDYLSKNILCRSKRKFFKLFLENLLIITIVCFLCKNIKLNNLNYFELIIMAIKNMGICISVIILFNILFNRKEIKKAKLLIFKEKRKA